MTNFVAAPGVNYYIGMPICRSKHGCDVVYYIDQIANLIYIKPMTFWERVKHEFNDDCQAQGEYL